jgi:hypothetical protein
MAIYMENVTMPENYRDGDSGKNTQSDQTSEKLSREFSARMPVSYYVEEDPNGKPLLPSVDSQSASRSIKPLREALEAMVDEITIKPLEFKQAGSRDFAQLIITAKKLPDDAPAVTDITPGGLGRITFNSNKHFDKILFEATTVHAVETLLGYPKRPYIAIPNDPYFRR